MPDVHLVSRRTQVAIETESTAGTAETLVAADVNVRVDGSTRFTYNPEIEPQDLMQADLSELPDLIGNRPVEIEFGTILAGSGTNATPPGFGEILIHGGFLETVNIGTSVVYTPETPPTTDTCTIGVWRGPTSGSNGKLFRAKGCRLSSATITITAGRAVRMNCTFMGALEDVTDAAAYSGVTYDATVPQTARNLNMTIGSWTPYLREMVINITNQIHMVENPGGTGESSGYSHAEIVARRIDGTLQFRDVLVATKDWLADLNAGTEAAFSAALGSASGNTLTFAGPKLQLLNPTEGDMDGVIGQTLDYKFNRDSGDDEFSITHT